MDKYRDDHTGTTGLLRSSKHAGLRILSMVWQQGWRATTLRWKTFVLLTRMLFDSSQAAGPRWASKPTIGGLALLEARSTPGHSPVTEALGFVRVLAHRRSSMKHHWSGKDYRGSICPHGRIGRVNPVPCGYSMPNSWLRIGGCSVWAQLLISTRSMVGVDKSLFARHYGYGAGL